AAASTRRCGRLRLRRRRPPTTPRRRTGRRIRRAAPVRSISPGGRRRWVRGRVFTAISTLSPCGRGCLRYDVSKAGEGSFSKPPLIRRGLRPRHLLPQGEKGRSACLLTRVSKQPHLHLL